MANFKGVKNTLKFLTLQYMLWNDMFCKFVVYLYVQKVNVTCSEQAGVVLKTYVICFLLQIQYLQTDRLVLTVSQAVALVAVHPMIFQHSGPFTALVDFSAGQSHQEQKHQTPHDKLSAGQDKMCTQLLLDVLLQLRSAPETAAAALIHTNSLSSLNVVQFQQSC